MSKGLIRLFFLGHVCFSAVLLQQRIEHIPNINVYWTVKSNFLSERHHYFLLHYSNLLHYSCRRICEKSGEYDLYGKCAIFLGECLFNGVLLQILKPSLLFQNDQISSLLCKAMNSEKSEILVDKLSKLSAQFSQRSPTFRSVFFEYNFKLLLSVSRNFPWKFFINVANRVFFLSAHRHSPSLCGDFDSVWNFSSHLARE